MEVLGNKVQMALVKFAVHLKVISLLSIPLLGIIIMTSLIKADCTKEKGYNINTDSNGEKWPKYQVLWEREIVSMSLLPPSLFSHLASPNSRSCIVIFSITIIIEQVVVVVRSIWRNEIPHLITTALSRTVSKYTLESTLTILNQIVVVCVTSFE